jgi:mRNA deadenylase 3'-5' endonuclease subunit Ccr4
MSPGVAASSLSVVTYNVLASAYINHSWYPRTPRMVLNPAWRVPALAKYVSALDADLLCLQEVEPDVLATLRTTLGFEYHVYYAPKGERRPDGVAIFYRGGKLEPVSTTRLAFVDSEAGSPASGYVAAFALFRAGDRVLGIINTHLLWDPPGAALELQRGYRQARQLLTEYEKTAGAADAWILAGDLNVSPDSALIAMIRQAGFEYSHSGVSDRATCNVNGRARMIDYIFYSAALRAEPAELMSVDDRTILPSAEQPSDHVAIAARVSWRN